MSEAGKMEEGGGREGKQRKRKLRKQRRGGKQKKQNTFKNGKWEVNAGEMR